MNFPHGNFDSKQFAVLQDTFDAVCRELGVIDADTASRDRIAEALIALAKGGQYDSERLKVYAMAKLKRSGLPM